MKKVLKYSESFWASRSFCSRRPSPCILTSSENKLIYYVVRPAPEQSTMIPRSRNRRI